MTEERSVRPVVGIAILLSGLGMMIAGLVLLLASEQQLAGGVIFGAGVLDLIVGFFFLRG